MSDEGISPGKFGKYELLSVIGEGAMARVYLAALEGPMGFRKELALKQIQAQTDKQQKLLKSLINEARLGGRLQHRNLVEIFEFDQVDETYYLAMEYIRGHTLRALLRTLPAEQGIPSRLVARIAIQICEGLHYAHGARDEGGVPMNLVHRDIKPANVIVRNDGVVKLMDFGVAKAQTNLFLTTPGSVKGTPVYMSPEQVRGEPLDNRSDIFAMGTLLAELLTGGRVFDGIEVGNVVTDLAEGKVFALQEKARTRAPEFRSIIERAMQPDPQDRYATAGEMAEAIRGTFEGVPGDDELAAWVKAVMGGEAPAPIADRPTPPPPAPATAAPRFRVLYLAMALGLTAVAVLVILMVLKG